MFWCDPFTPTDYITPIGSWIFPGDDIEITNAPGYDGMTVMLLLLSKGIVATFPQVTEAGFLVTVDDKKKALEILRREGISAY